MNLSIAMLTTFILGSTSLADTPVESMSDEQLRSTVFELKGVVDVLQGQVDTLQSSQNDDWLTERRADEIRGLVSDVLADADTRASLQGDGMNGGYDRGFFVGSADGNWLIRLNGQIQVRWIFNEAKKQANDYGFEIRRMKLNFSGHIVDPSWEYRIVVVSNREAVEFQDKRLNPNVFVEDVFIKKVLDNGMYIQAGQFVAPFTREELVSSQRQLAVERSVVNNAFTWTRTQGIMVGYQNDMFRIDAMYNQGPNNLNSAAASLLSSRQGLNVRAEMLFGEDSDWGLFDSMNARSTDGNTAFLLGGAFGWFNGGIENVQQYGNANVPRSVAFTVDGTLIGDGWQLFSYFVWSDGKNRYLSPARDTQESWGVVVQGGLLVTEDLELFARYSLGEIPDGVSEGGLPSDNLNVFTVGGNMFFNPNVKLTMDWGYAFNPVTGGGNAPTSPDYTSSGTGWRRDIGDEDGQWLLRAQMQLIF
ncbi:MAG: hypothetical protein CMJ24_10535 [Phycisphaerae bacterium]|nr:hypothetical protein [Phycisphaerae bacterium]